MNKDRFKRFGIGFGVAFILLWASTFLLEWGLPLVIDFDALKNTVEEGINETVFARVPVKISISKLRARPTFIRGLQVTLSPVTVTEAPKKEEAAVEAVIVNLRYWPLITQQKFVPSRILLKHPRLEIDPDSSLYRLAQHPELATPDPATLAESGGSPPPEFILKDTDLVLEKYDIILNRLQNLPAVFLLKGNKLAVKPLPTPLNKKKTVRLIGNTSISFEAGSAEIKPGNAPSTLPLQRSFVGDFMVDTTVSRKMFESKPLETNDVEALHLKMFDVDLAHLSTLLKPLGVQEKASGKLNRWILHIKRKEDKSGSLHRINLFVQNKERLALQTPEHRFKVRPATIRLKTDYRNLPQKHRGDLENLLLEIRSKALSLQITGALANTAAQKPEDIGLDLNIKTNLTPVKSFYIIPKSFPGGELLHHTRGKIKLEARIEGPASAPKIPKGRLEMENLTLKQNKHTLSIISGSIYWDRRRQEFRNISGKLDGERFALSGAVNPEKQELRNAKFYTPSLDLSRVLSFYQSLLNSLKQPTPEFLKNFQTKGHLVAELDASGSLKTPKINGKLGVQNIEITPVGRPASNLSTATPLKISIPRGILRFQNQHVELQNLAILQANNRLTISGGYERKKDALNLSVKAPALNLKSFSEALFGLQALMLKQPPPPLRVTQGSADTNLKITGPLKKPDYSGSITFNSVKLVSPEQKPITENLHGTAIIQKNILLNTKGAMGRSAFQLGGSLDKDFKAYRLTLYSESLNLQDLTERVGNFNPKLAVALKDYQKISGTGHVNLIADKTRNTPEPSITGNVSLSRLVIQPSKSDLPLLFDKLDIQLTPGKQLVIPKTFASFGPIRFSMEGRMTSPGTGNPQGKAPLNYDIYIATGPIPMTTLRDQQDVLREMSGADLPELWNAAGFVTLNIHARPETLEATAAFNKVSFSWEDGDFPVHNLNGILTVRQEADKTFFIQTQPGLSLEYANAAIYPELQLNTMNNLSASLRGVLSELAMNHYLTLPGAENGIFSAVPFTMTMDGQLKALTAESEGAFSLAGEFDTTRLLSNLNQVPDPASLSATGVLDQPPAIPVSTLAAKMNVTDGTVLIQELGFKAGETADAQDTLLHIMGGIQNAFIPEPGLNQFRVQLADIQLEKYTNLFGSDYFQNIGGTLSGEVLMESLGIPETEMLTGMLKASHVKLPAFQLQELDGSAQFNGMDAKMDVGTFKIPGINVSFNGNIPDIAAKPFQIRDPDVKGDLFVIDAYNAFVENVIIGKIQRQLLEPVFGPYWDTEPLPFEVRDTDVSLKEVIYKNIILNDVTSNLSFYANGYAELKNTKLTVAGGNVLTNIFMNPRDNNFLSVDMQANQVESNALARALLNQTNVISGKMDGNIRFTTQGIVESDMIKHTNGTANFEIKDGRLPDIVKIETLLTAANIIRGGLIGLNLNNLFRAVKPFNTSSTQLLYGDLQLAEGVAYTTRRDIVSDGENLDLVIQGNVNMADGNGHLVVNGAMSQDVSGILGPLGKLSLSRVVRYIPGLGYLPGTKRSLINLIPGVGWIPGFGGPAQDINRFQVEIQGPLDDPGSVQDLQWLQ